MELCIEVFHGYAVIQRKIHISAGQWHRQKFYWEGKSDLFGGGVESVGVWGGALKNFSLTTPTTLAIHGTNAPFIG